jgi:hypothetical protein
MQKDIHYYEKFIQEKRKKTPWREFVKEIASWTTLNFYKRDGMDCRYPPTNRITHLWKNFWEEAPDIDCNIKDWTSFFSHFKQFQDKIPLQYLLDFWNNENCGYADSVFWWAKNIYLSFVTGYKAENIAYSAYCYTNVSDIYNSFFCCKDNSNIYMSASVTQSYNIFYSKFVTNSSNVWFSTNLIGCEECILCDNLENKKYCIKNKEYPRESYVKMKAELMWKKGIFILLHKGIADIKAINIWSEDISWNNIIKTHDTENGFWINNIHQSRNVVIGNGGDGCESFYDAVDVGIDSDNFYATSAVWYKTHHIYCSSQIWESSYLYYCYFIENCHHCLGCIWLKNKSYCILNKQYAKEEWEEKVCEIFASMESDGTLGQFFPASMNPFYFNDTLAYIIDDTFTKEEVEAEWYLWRDEPIRADIPEGVRMVQNTELDQFQGYDAEWNWKIHPEVLNIVISDEKWNYYRIVKMEYDFLMKHALPLPTTHWLDRIKMGFR